MESNKIFDASKFLESFKLKNEKPNLDNYAKTSKVRKEPFKIKKTIDKNYAKSLEIIETKIFIENFTKHIFNNVIVQDNIYPGTTFIVGSCYINNKQYMNIYPQLGVKLNKIDAFETIVIKFLVRINMSNPLPSYVEGFATVFFYDGKSINSNIVKINIRRSEGEEEHNNIIMQKNYENLCFYKTNNQIGSNEIMREKPRIEVNLCIENSFYKNGNIKCVLKIKNNGKSEVFEVKIIDDLKKEKGFIVIPTKIKVNGEITTYRSLEEIIIDRLDGKETYCIEFNLSPYKNIECKALQLYCCFEYYDNTYLQIGHSNYCNEALIIERTAFKDCNFNFSHNIPEYLEEPNQIDDVNIECFITKRYPIKTYKGSGYDENLTGYGIKIIGEILFIIEYTTVYGTIHSINFRKKFSSIIVVRAEVYEKENFQIECLVVDSIVDILEEKFINVSVNILFLSDC